MKITVNAAYTEPREIDGPVQIVVQVSHDESIVIQVTNEGVILDGFDNRVDSEPVQTWAKTFGEFLDGT